jgi:hypothetical protein
MEINKVIDTVVLDAVTVVDRLQDVPAQVYSGNVYMRDVIGNKTDYLALPFNNETSVIGHLNTLYYHIHGTAFTAPALADSVTVTKSTTAWELGTAQELIAADSTLNAFDVHYVVIDNISANGQFELHLIADDTTTIGRVVFSRSATFSQEAYIPIQIPPQAAGTKITAKLAGSGTGATTCGVKLVGHYYGV